MSKVISILLAIVLFMGVGAGISAAVIYNKPENVAFSAVQGAIEDLFERDEIAPVWNMLHEGSLYVSVNKIQSDDYDVLDGGSVSGKIYFSEDAIMADDIAVDLFGVKVKGDIYASSDMIYISEDEIIDGGYGIVYKDAAEDFKKSIFAFGSDSDYAIQDEEIYDSIVEALESLADTDNKQLKKDAEELTEEHIKNIWKIVCENVEFESENDEVRLNGESEKVRVVTIKIESEDIANIVKAVYEYLCEDESIGDFLDQYGSSLMAASSSDESDSMGELYEEYLDNMEEQIEAICDEIESADGFDDIEIKIITPKMSHKLLKAEVEVDGDTVFSIDFGKDGVKKTNEINIEVAGEELSYVISENTKDTYEAELEVYDNTFMKVSIDKKGESYKLSLGDGYVTVKGDYIADGDTTTITVEKVDTEYREDGIEITGSYEMDVTIIIDEKDDIPAAPDKFDRISDITEEDIEKWVEKIQDLFGVSEEEYSY